MPRRKPTEAETDNLYRNETDEQYRNDPYRRGLARWAYLSTHPEEWLKERSAQRDRYDRLAQAHLKKYQPVVTDMNFNGQFVTVDFTRNNGERVSATYQLCLWENPPANLWNQKEPV